MVSIETPNHCEFHRTRQSQSREYSTLVVQNTADQSLARSSFFADKRGEPMCNALPGLLSALLLCGTIGTARAADFTLGTATAQSGRKATGFLQVPAGIDPATDIPVAVLNGTRPGPTLALVAGSHGTEYASIVALQKMIQTVDPADIAGVLIIVPLVNPGSFRTESPSSESCRRQKHEPVLPGKD